MARSPESVVRFLGIICLLFSLSAAAAPARRHGKADVSGVTYDGRSLMLNGRRELFFSGSIHYPRSSPEMWPGLIQKAKRGGLNVIQTYVFWNVHEPEQGQYNFTGRYDLVRFIKLINEHKMYATLRIGPFIQAEWNHGGFPYWMKEVPNIVFRTDNEPFKYHMQIFVTKIMEMMKSENLFFPQGGPIILAQIDACNGRNCGDTFAGPNSPTKPILWTENWTAQYRVFGDPPSQRSAEDIAYSVARFFSKNGTLVNYYMVNAQHNARTFNTADVTRKNDKWEMFQERIPKFLKRGIVASKPLELYNMTKDTTDYVWYTTRFRLEAEDLPMRPDIRPVLQVSSLGHALHAFVNRIYIGSGQGAKLEKSFVFQNPMELKRGINHISILGMTVGFPDNGAYLEHRLAGVHTAAVQGLNTGTLDLSRNRWGHERELRDLHNNSLRGIFTNLILSQRYFDMPRGHDPVALDMTGMGKGLAWVNGNCIGRYWVSYLSPLGEPSQSVYHVPRGWLKPKDNLLVIFEEHGGNPEGLLIVTVKRDNICTLVSEFNPPPIESFSREDNEFKNLVQDGTPRAILKCDGKKKVIRSIPFASFGNPTGVCGNFTVGTCHSPLAASIVEKVVIYEKPERKVRAAFLTNTNPGIDGTANFTDVEYSLPRPSISILPDCYVSDDGSPKMSQSTDMSVFRDAVKDYLDTEPSRTAATVPSKSNKPRSSNAVEVEKFSGLRIRNPLVSSVEISNRFSDIRFVRLPAIRNLLVGDTLSGCWVTVGVLIVKGAPKTSSAGKSYSIWKMGCLDETDASVFLFGDAYSKSCNEPVGSVFALFNSAVRKDMLKLGTSADYGVCKGKRKDGMACTMIINNLYTVKFIFSYFLTFIDLSFFRRQVVYCKFHTAKASHKYSTMRAELKGGNLNSAFKLQSEGIYMVDPLADRSNLRKPFQPVKVMSVDGLKKALSNADKVTTNSQSQGIRFLTQVTANMESKISNKGSAKPNQIKCNSDKRSSLAMKMTSKVVGKGEQRDAKRKKTHHASENMIELDIVSSDEES
ncbi:putative protein MCM10 [Cocos nucifera]|uniref:beta-galactosidase n=1 Tax=Cocos nucifera TaxID=13894 RepID=A0A8K0N7C3_COCNU|nr:putative protein MCM10 [Cocos nucifera]